MARARNAILEIKFHRPHENIFKFREILFMDT